MIGKDLTAAAEERYDLIVIGGGVYGVAHLLEASRLGLRALLIERDDFGGATSWNSLRIVHGGLRYLQSIDLPRVFESTAARRWWLEHFPDLVQPLACVMPLSGRGLRRRSVLGAALAVNELLSAGRNRGLAPEAHLPRGRTLSRRELEQRFPELPLEAPAGAALWYDARAPRPQRLLIEMLRWAAACGATALNYVEATGLRIEAGSVEGVEVRSAVDGRVVLLRADAVVNCAGPWCREVAARFDRDRPSLFRRSLAFNLLLDRPAVADAALAVQAPTKNAQTFFLCPWRGRLLAGTCHSAWSESDGEGVSEAQLAGFLSELERALPGERFHPTEVSRVLWGFLPARAAGESSLAVRPTLVDHGATGGPRGLWSVSGVKLTTAPTVARDTLARIVSRLDRAPAPVTTARPPVNPCPELPELAACFERAPERAAEQIATLVQNEAVRTLDDLVLRRSDWGLDPDYDDRLARRVAQAAGLDPKTGSG